MYDTGRYRAKITEQTFGENKKGNPELALTVQPLGYYNDKDGQLVDAHFEWPRTVYLTLTEGTLGKPDAPGWVMQTLRFLGFNATSFAALDPNVDGACSFVGTELDVLCQHSEYEGKTREKWSILTPRGARPAGKPIEKKAVRQLDAKFGKVLKATAAAAAGAPAAKPAGESPAESPAEPQESEDIPF